MRVVLCGYYGKGNSGDEALLATLLQMLPPHVEPIVLSGNPAETTARYGVKSCDRNNWNQVLQALKQSQAFIFGGGSLIQDATSLMSPLYYTGLMLLAQRLGLTTIAWAQGIGPLNSPLTRWVSRLTFSGCRTISVRDAGSAGLLSRWAIPAIQAPDPVWAMTAKPLSVRLKSPTPRIAIALRPHASLTPQRTVILTQALIQLQHLTQASFILLPFHPSQDQILAKQVQSQLPGTSEILVLDDPRELKAVFQHVDLTIGMRFHALIMALSEGCPSIALSYDPKVTQLMQAVQLPGWELTAMSSDPFAIAQDWHEIYENRQSVSYDLPQTMRDRALEHQHLLLEALR
jgi:polysaccharide pyruvyl transferase CsaB